MDRGKVEASTMLSPRTTIASSTRASVEAMMSCRVGRWVSSTTGSLGHAAQAQAATKPISAIRVRFIRPPLRVRRAAVAPRHRHPLAQPPRQLKRITIDGKKKRAGRESKTDPGDDRAKASQLGSDHAVQCQE